MLNLLKQDVYLFQMSDILIPFALNKHGEQVSIDEVKNGLACECVCISCNSAMVARNNGTQRQPYFAHLRAGKADLKCTITFENSVFWMAEKIIKKSAEGTKLSTPSLISDYDNTTLIANSGAHQIDVETVHFFAKTSEICWTFIVDVVSRDKRHPVAVTLSFSQVLSDKGPIEHNGKLLSHLVIELSDLRKNWANKKTGFTESLCFELFENPENRSWAYHERSKIINKRLDEQNLARLEALKKNKTSKGITFSDQEKTNLDKLASDLKQWR